MDQEKVVKTRHLAKWHTGFQNETMQPLLILTFSTGESVGVIMPAQTAWDLAEALRIEALRAMSVSDEKPN